MKIKLVLCWLVVVFLSIGCSSVYKTQIERSHKITGRTKCVEYRAFEIVIPSQRTGELPFTLRRGKTTEDVSEKDLATMAMVAPYFNTITTAAGIPIRCKDGLVLKRAGKWYRLRFGQKGVPIIDCYIAQRGGG